MKFQFKLRNGKDNSTIIAELRNGSSIRIRLATSYLIPNQSHKYWDSSKEVIKHPNDIPDSKGINQKLMEIRSKVYSTVVSSSIQNTFNKQELRDRLDLIINPIDVVEEPDNSDNTKSNDVISYFDWYIDFFSKNIVPTTGRILSNGTIRGYKNSSRYLRDYLNDRKIKKFTFDDITKDFYYDYIQYSQEQGHSKNYIGSMIQKLKTIIRSAFDDDLHSNNEFRKYYFKKFSEEINHPYLTEEEIQALYNLKIYSEHLDAIRDIFVIACYTGLRIGDLMRFLKNPKIEFFNGRKHINIVQGKTNKPVFIPLKRIILDILEKRNGEFPRYIHKNIINKEIKPLLKKCGVTQTVFIEKTIGGKLVMTPMSKHLLISCHSARRSFCTNAYNAGMPLRDIMVFSGHSSEKMVLLYIKASAKDKAKHASDHVFFT